MIGDEQAMSGNDRILNEYDYAHAEPDNIDVISETRVAHISIDEVPCIISDNSRDIDLLGYEFEDFYDEEFESDVINADEYHYANYTISGAEIEDMFLDALYSIDCFPKDGEYKLTANFSFNYEIVYDSNGLIGIDVDDYPMPLINAVKFDDAS